MSLGPITQHEWLNRNSLRAFPVVDDARLLFNSGEDMPNSVIVDLFLAVALPGPGDVYVRSVSFTAKTVTVVLSDLTTSASIGYATAILGSTPPNTPIPIQSPDGLASGTLVLGNILDRTLHSDYGAYIGVHNQTTGVRLDRRCYIYSGKPIIESLRADLQDGEASGSPTISLGNELQAEISELLINGVKETQVELSLVTPENYLPDCYPKYIDPLCYCEQRPIVTVNGVPRDEDGDLGIDIQFSGGVISNEGDQNLIELTVDRRGTEVCFEDPIIPDGFGRIGPLFGTDCPPDGDYGIGSNAGPACPNPPRRPPGGPIIDPPAP